MHYHPLTDPDREEMLKDIHARSFDDLIRGIPKNLRDPKLEIPEALSELEVLSLLRDILAKNVTAKDVLSFLGAGSYEHFIPAVVPQIAMRNEFYTAYTPYQPEASQGTLQVIYEYQSLITELTGMDVSNASHYDGATSMVEAALMALRHTDRTKILVSNALHPHYRETLKTYFAGTPYQIEDFPFLENGTFDRSQFLGRLGPQTAGAIFQTPNFFGVIEDLSGISEALHTNGSLLILTAHPLALAVVKTPGEWGADVAVGEGQPLGIPQQFGGPYLGYLAATRSLMRRMPGRLVGMTKDTEGRRAYVLTLKAREQDIRRERASSNICTNQGLCALMACVYMTVMGRQGMKELAEINLDRALYLRQRIAQLKSFEVDTQVTVFNEFVVRSKIPLETLAQKLMKEKIFPGVDLAAFYPERKNQFLVCATETKTREQLDRFVEVLKRC